MHDYIFDFSIIGYDPARRFIQKKGGNCENNIYVIIVFALELNAKGDLSIRAKKTYFRFGI